LLTSSNGGATWQRVGPAQGGDKEWMAIDTTTGPGGQHLSGLEPFANTYNNPNFLVTRSTDGAAPGCLPWAAALASFWHPSTSVGRPVDVFAFDGSQFWLNRSSDATNQATTPTFDLYSAVVDLNGEMPSVGSTRRACSGPGLGWP